MQTPPVEQPEGFGVSQQHMQRLQATHAESCQPSSEVPKNLKRSSAVLKETLPEMNPADDVAESLSRACSTAPATDRDEGEIWSLWDCRKGCGVCTMLPPTLHGRQTLERLYAPYGSAEGLHTLSAAYYPPLSSHTARFRSCPFRVSAICHHFLH